ncbi:MAG: serine/threonine protein kinase [Oligoflexia bacterium]|nr:serine/threonine protein kinase [Oligoflexia bacterium]
MTMTNISHPNNLCGYSLIKKIGEGAMSEVFLAHLKNELPEKLEGDNSEVNAVAIKIPRVYIKNKKEYVKRIRKEAEILNLLSDQRIVKLISVEEKSDGSIYLIQEFVDGKNLEELLVSDVKKARPVVGATIISEILLGLEEAHRHKIIHRDLKPENIMITSEGRLKITDFGVSKNMENIDHTTTGIIIGSPAYISPEQIKGKEIGPESDLFTLGVILYRYSTGEFPFHGDTCSSLLHNILNAEIIPVSKLNPKIHPQLAKIIDKALKKDPEKRYRRSYEFRYDLMKYLDHIGAINPTHILKLYYQQNPEIDYFAEDSLLNTLIVRAENALKDGDTQSGITLVQQTLSIDPENQDAKKLLYKFKNKFSAPLSLSLKLTTLSLITLIIVIVMALFYFSQLPITDKSKKINQQVQQVQQMPVKKTSPSNLSTIITPLSSSSSLLSLSPLSATTTNNLSAITNKTTPTLNKVDPIIHKTKNIKNSKKIIKTTTTAETTTTTTAVATTTDTDTGPVSTPALPAAAVSWIVINNDNDVEVNIDGKRYDNTSGKPLEVSVGTHSITLRKANNPPITSTIETIATKTTIINAK